MIPALFGHSAASIVIPISLKDLTLRSGVVFAGTVEKLDYVQDAKFGLLTHITFSKLVSAKTTGSPKTLTLTLRGGKAGSRESFVVGLPRFEVGKRYLVFADADLGSSKNSFVPFIGLDQGVFEIENKLVRDSMGRSVVAVIGDNVVCLDKPHGKTDELGTVKPTISTSELESGGHGVPKGGRVIRVRAEGTEDPLNESPSNRALPAEARHLGARAIDGAAYVVPAELDPGSRVTEDVFVASVRNYLDNR